MTNLLASFIAPALAIVLQLPANAGAATAAPPSTNDETIHHRTVKVDGVSIFYREAGRQDAPTLLLLHGFPSSSRMFDPLISRLAARYHLVAPDYPGFGHSDAPAPDSFSYTFNHLAEVMGDFVQALSLKHYALYLQDYGGPVGFRLAMEHPERITGLIIQNAVAHEDGLGPLWETRRAFWAERAKYEAAVEKNLLSPDATRNRHIGSSPNADRYDPDLWSDELAFLNRPGETTIQSDLFYSYQTNVAAYPRWQSWLKQRQPPTLVIWGKYDPSFLVAEATAYLRDLPQAEIHILNAGHFAMDEQPAEVAELVERFMAAGATPAPIGQ